MSRNTSAVLWLAAGLGCTHAEPYVWVSAVPAAVAVPNGPYVIQVGDLLGVSVWEQDTMTARARVRPDGRISIPLLGEVSAVGKRPEDLGRELEDALRDRKYFNDPRVLVDLEEARPTTVLVLGEVAHPGALAIGPTAGVLQALASAGGLTEFADKDRIFVIRKGVRPPRIRFRFSELIGGDTRASQFRLRNDDIVQVQ